jgi:hypothetical protein
MRPHWHFFYAVSLVEQLNQKGAIAARPSGHRRGRVV